MIFAEVPEYLAQVAGIHREHLGEFGVRFPLGRIFPAGNLVFESLQVICEVGVGFHGSDAFPLVEFRFLAVAILLGDEVIEPAGYLVADQRVEVFQGIPGGLELIFAEVPEYLAQVAGIHREHLGEFGVCLPLSLVFPAGNLVFESHQVVCEVGVSFHGPVFLSLFGGEEGVIGVTLRPVSHFAVAVPDGPDFRVGITLFPEILVIGGMVVFVVRDSFVRLHCNSFLANGLHSISALTLQSFSP